MMQYNILPAIRPFKDIHKKYDVFFSELNRSLQAHEKTDEYFGTGEYMLSLMKYIENNQVETNGFSFNESDVTVDIKSATTRISYWNDILGEEPTKEIFSFIYEIKELNDTYVSCLDKPEVGIFYPKEEIFPHYKICPQVFLTFANCNSKDEIEINTRINFLTYETIQNITQKIEQVMQGVVSNYVYEFEDWFPAAFKNPSIYSYYYMLVYQETTIFGYYFEDRDIEDYEDSWSDNVIVEVHTIQVYQLFKDYEDCWYEAESGLPIHWRKSLK